MMVATNRITVIFLMFLTIQCLIAQTLDELKNACHQQNIAKNWNDLAS